MIGRLALSVLVAAAAVFLFSPARAQAPPTQPPVRGSYWQVDWGDRRCSLIRHPDGDQPMLAVRTTPGTRAWELLLIRSHWPGSLRGDHPRAVVRLQPTALAVGGTVSGGRTPLGLTVSIDGLPNDFIDRLSESQALSVGTERATVFEIPLQSVRQAVAALRECETSALQEWGIDPVAFRAVSVPPSGNLAQFVTDRDYPAEALSRNLSGTSVVAVAVEADGRISECAPVSGDRIPSLDEATCRVFLRRARMMPARDAQGNAIRSQLVTRITWRISGS